MFLIFVLLLSQVNDEMGLNKYNGSNMHSVAFTVHPEHFSRTCWRPNDFLKCDSFSL